MLHHQTKTTGNSNKKNENVVNSVKTTVVQKSLHDMISPGKQTQTDNFSSEILRRFESILTGPHSGAFCQVMDTFVSGYGTLNIDTELLFIRFVYEEKLNFEKMNYFQTLVVLDHHHMKSKPYQIIIKIFNNGLKVENKMSNINTK